jgi:hypothetical protein
MAIAFTGGAWHRAAAGLALAGLSCWTAPAQADGTWSLRLPKEDAVAYRGVVSFDAAGTPGGAFQYPVGGAGAGGFIVAVLTHGLLVESQKNREKQAMQDAADKVLSPYRAVLDGLRHPELMRKALDKTRSGTARKLLAASESAGTGWLVESQPVFGMTQDQRALVLDNSVTIQRVGDATGTPYQATVRVVSQPRAEEDVQAFWKTGEGAALKAESISLLAHSLELAVRDAGAAAASEPPTFKTVRYQEGTAEKMERAQLVAHHCGREVIRTLRGWLMSVPAPAASDAAPEPCETALPGWK